MLGGLVAWLHQAKQTAEPALPLSVWHAELLVLLSRHCKLSERLRWGGACLHRKWPMTPLPLTAAHKAGDAHVLAARACTSVLSTLSGSQQS